MNNIVIKNRIQILALLLKHSGNDFNAVLPQNFQPASRVCRVRIGCTDNDSGNSGGKNRLGTCACSPVRRTGFEGYKKRCAGFRIASERIKRNTLGMRRSRARMEALGNDFSVLNDDCADKRIRMRIPAGFFGELNRAPHESVELCHF